MEENNFWLDLMATLKKGQSKKQVQTDAKNLGDIKVPLIGTLNKSKTKAQIKQDLASLNGTIELIGKVDKKGITTAVQQATQQAQNTAKAQPIQIDFSVKKEKLINDIKLLAQQNSRLFKDTNMTAKYNSLLDNAKLATSSKELQNLRLQLRAFRSELKVTGNAGLTLTDALKNGLSRALQLFGSYGIIMQFTKQLRNAWTEAENLDAAMTDLARVNAEISRDNFPDYLDRCISKCKQLSVAVEDYIASVTTFSRAGYNLADSEALADMSIQLEKVGDMSAEAASKALLSGIQTYSEIDGYGMDQLAEKAQALNDKIDLIGNTASITQKEVAEGIEAVGSVMADANTSVDEFIALLGAGNRATQDANKVALAIRTSALRIRSCTAELEEMGETTDDVIESTADLARQIKALTNIDGSGGVNILEADGETFRSIFDIYNDISKVYDKMSDIDASALLDLIAGVHRSSQVSAIIANMAEANDLLNKSLNATGTASSEFEIYLSSTAAATERFGVAMTESYNSIINGETVKALANAGTAVLDFANKWGLLESTLKGFLAIKIMKGIGTLTTAIKGSIVQVTNFGTALNTVKSMDGLAKGTQKYTDALNILKTSCTHLTSTQLKQILSNTALSNSERIKILQYQGLTKEQAKARLSQLGLTQATNAQTAANAASTASTFSLKAAMIGLGATIKSVFLSNPVGIVLMGISVAVSAVTSAVSKHNQKMEELREKAKEAASEANMLGDEIAGLASKYLSLSEAVKTDKSAKEDLMTTQTELLKKLGLESEGVEELTAKYGSLSEAIRQASIDALKNAQIDLLSGVNAAKEELLKAGADGLWGGKNTINAIGKDAVKAYKELEKAGIVDSGSYGSYSAYMILTGNTKTTEGILENYKKLEDALSVLRDSNAFTAEELSDNSLYKALYSRYSELKESVENYNSSIADLNENLAQQMMLQALQGKEIPKTENAFEAFRQELIDTAIASKQFIGNEQEIAEVINNFLSTLPEFAGFYSAPLEDELEKADEIKKNFSNLFSQLNNSKESIDKFQSSIKSAYEAYNKLMSGDYTASELLDSIQAINEAASDMGKQIDWELIGRLGESGYDDPLKILGRAIDYISLEYAKTSLVAAGFSEQLAKQIIQEEKLAQQLDMVNTSIDNLQTAYDNLYNIVEAYNEVGYLTIDQLQTLLSLEPEYLACLISEDGQLRLNQETLEILAEKRLNEAKALVLQRMTTELNELAVKEEQKAIENNTTALQNNEIEITKYSNKLEGLLPVIGDATEEFAKLSIAMDGAFAAGASEEEVNNIIAEGQKLLNFIDSVSIDIHKSPKQYHNVMSGSSGSGSSKSSGSSSTPTPEEFNWIERAIANIEHALTRLKNAAQRTWESWEFRATKLNGALSTTRKELQAQQNALSAYKSAANKVSLSSYYKNLVNTGAYRIDSITDDNLKEKIKQYQSLVDKIRETELAIDSLRDAEVELLKQKFDNISTQYSLRRDNRDSKLENYTIKFEAKADRGYVSNKEVDKYYKEYNKVLTDNIKDSQAEVSKLQAQLDEMVRSGSIKKYSQDWYELSNTIQEARNNVVTYQEQLNQNNIDKATMKLDQYIEKAEFFTDSNNFKKATKYYWKSINDLSNWSNSLKKAGVSLDEIKKKVLGYVDSLKELHDTQRDLKLDKIDAYTNIATSGYAYTVRAQNKQLKYSNTQLNNQDKAYKEEVTQANKDVKRIGKNSTADINKELKSQDAKGNSTDAKAYKKALNNAKKAINNKSAVATADLKVIKAHSTSLYSKLYAYNLSLDNLEVAKLERATNLAVTTSQRLENISQKYENKDSRIDDRIDLLQMKSSNATTVKSKNNKLDKIAAQYDKIIANDKSEVKDYQKLQKQNAKKIKNQKAKGDSFKSLSDEKKKKVKECIKKARDAAKKGVSIGTSVMDKLAKYYVNGYISDAFYLACVNYNEAIERREEAEAQLEIDQQTAIQEKAALGTEKFNNVEQKYTNKQNEIKSNKNKESIRQSIKSTKGHLLSAQDYQALLNYSVKEQKSYENEIEELNKTIQENLSSGYWTTASQEYKDAINSVRGYEEEVLNCQLEQEELNNQIAQLPYTIFDKALSLIQSIKENFQSLLSIKTTRGVSKTDSDILTEIGYVNVEMEKQVQRRQQLWEDYQKALANGGAYGGKDSDEWLTEFYEADTKINNLKADVEALNNEIAQLPYDRYEKALSLLDNIAQYNKSIANLTKAYGKDLSADDYMTQINDNNAKIQNYEQQRIQAYSDYLKALSSYDGAYGGMTADEWLGKYYELGSTINGLKSDNEDIRDALRDDVYWRTFERAHKAAKALKDILSGIGGLFDDNMLYDKDGKYTDFGIAQIANLIKQYETARKEVQNYTDDIKNLDSLYAQGYYNQDEFNDKLNELQNGLFDAASSMKSYISEIIEMNKKLAQSELDDLFKLIDARNDALRAKKAYYDYDKTIKGKTKDIQSLQSQIAALDGIVDAESKAKKARLEADLAEAKDDLNDTIINHSFELSMDALDELKKILQDEFDEKWETIYQDFDQLKELMAASNELTSAQTHAIQSALNKLFSFYGIDPSSTDLSAFGNYTGYASGTRSVDRDKVAWTQENGKEIIIRKSDGAILTPLSRGDSVIPNDLSNKLFEWGNYYPQEFANQLISKLPIAPKVQSQQNDFSVHLGSMVNIEGNVVEEELPKLKNIIDMAYKHTISEIAKDARKNGIKV